MKAIQVDKGRPGLPLTWGEAPDPVCGSDDVVLDVHATALNRADLMQRQGNYPPPPGGPDIMGLEAAGVVAQAGANVRGWGVGDRACVLLGGGGYAEKVATPASMLMSIPSGWSFIEAATLPEVFLTAFVNLFMEAGFREEETVLVHGGASGVGTAAIQLIHHAGGRVLVTVGSDEKAAACQKLGADLVINYRTEDWAVRVHDFTGGRGVDIIMDMVGADYFARNLGLLMLKGRLVFISTLSGGKVELDLRALMSRRLRIIGSVLRSRPLAEKAEITRRFGERFGSLLDAGTIKPVIDSVFPIGEAEKAHRRMAENANIGKIVLAVRDEAS